MEDRAMQSLRHPALVSGLSQHRRRCTSTNSSIGCLTLLSFQVEDFQQGQAQVADGVQDAMQGGLINDLPDQQRLVRLPPAQRESAQEGFPLLSQLALHPNA